MGGGGVAPGFAAGSMPGVLIVCVGRVGAADGVGAACPGGVGLLRVAGRRVLLRPRRHRARRPHHARRGSPGPFVLGDVRLIRLLRVVHHRHHPAIGQNAALHARTPGGRAAHPGLVPPPDGPAGWAGAVLA